MGEQMNIFSASQWWSHNSRTASGYLVWCIFHCTDDYNFAIIQAHALQGTTVYSDEGAAYNICQMSAIVW